MERLENLERGDTATRVLLERMKRKLEWGWGNETYDLKAMMANRAKSV